MPVLGARSKLQRRSLGFACTFLGTLTCLIGTSTQASEAVEPTTRIAHGKAAGECALPPVMHLKMGNECTGTLIHPQVVLYAAHCRKLRRLIFGESGQGPVIASVKKSITHPDFNQSNSSGPNGAAIDWAVGVLDAPVKGVPIIPLAYAGELEQYQKAGQEITLAGYGKTQMGFSPGRLMWTTAKIGQISNGSMTSVKGKQNACGGDSGGPVLVRLEDGSWRTIGITTNLGPTLSDCGKDTGYNRFSQVRPEMIKWLEEQSGFDLTPCYNADGEVDKSEGCKNFYAGDINSPSGSWKNNCSDAKVVKEPKLTPKGSGGGGDGGDGNEDKKDEKAPEITIEGVKNKSKIELGKKVKIKLEVKDQSEVKAVSLEINGDEVESWDEAPYAFSWKPEEAGTFTIQALAEDEHGNKGKSKTLKVTVQEEESEETEGNDTKGDETEGDETKGEDSTDGNTEGKGEDTKGGGEPDEDANKKDDETGDSKGKKKDKKQKEVPTKGGCNLSGPVPGSLGFGFVALLALIRRRRHA